MQLGWLLDVLPEYYTDNELQTNALYDDDIRDILNGIPHQDLLAEKIVLTMKDTMKRGAKKQIKKHNLAKYGISFSLENREARQFLGDKMELELSNYRGNIHGTTKKKIGAILKKSEQEGLSYAKTSKLIQSQGKAGVFTQARGEMIAVHEVNNAYEKGRETVTSEFLRTHPDKKAIKWWVTMGDDDVTDECLMNEAKGEIDFHEPFPSGDMHAPRGGHPRCRCHTSDKIV